MKIGDSPCKTCTDRTAECHGSCERYKSWKGEYEKWKAEKHKYDVEEYIMRDYTKQKTKSLRRIMSYYNSKK